MNLKEEPLNSMNMEIEEYKKRISELEEEIKLLNLDLKSADDEVEKLKGGRIPITIVDRTQIIKFIRDMISRSLHTLSITTPTIADLVELELYDVKTSVSIKACTNIESSAEDQELLQELDAMGNMNIRIFKSMDRWVCIKDNEEIFIAPIGENGIGAFFVDDHRHNRFFNSLAMESWLIAKKLNQM